MPNAFNAAIICDSGRFVTDQTTQVNKFKMNYEFN